MERLAPPAHSARSTYVTCISRVRNPGLKARLTAAADAVAAASAEFHREARRGRVHEIAEHDVVAPDVTVNEMEKVYSQRMAKAGAPGRAVYDEIFAAPSHGRCPLCAQRSVATLDHHLPKARFPALAVAPLNLVPACFDCNWAKLARAPAFAEEAPLHPYYDDLGVEVWLQASVLERRPAAVRFRVAAPAAWSAVLGTRMKNHFRVLGLGKLYASQAAGELVIMRHQLRTIIRADGTDGVRRELGRRAESAAAARPNSWQAAAYRAWSESAWFREGGFSPEG